MAEPSRIGSITTDLDSTNPHTAVSFAHTVDVGTTLLVVTVSLQGAMDTTVVPAWDGTPMTAIRDQGTQGSGNIHAAVYGIISPSTGTLNVTATLTAGAASHGFTAINYQDTDTASVAAAANFLSEDINNAATSTSVHASAGTAGRLLVIHGAARGQDMQPATVDNSFSEVYDEQTGTDGSEDEAHFGAELAASAPSAVTITWATSDENSSIYFELLPAPAAGTAPKNPLGHPFAGPIGGPI